MSATPVSVLVLGGTSWLGGASARHAVRAGHRVTCLARGSSGTAPDSVEFVEANRDDPATAYASVADRSWDAVIDVARQPRHVRGALTALSGRVGHWVFVSTCSVYADDSVVGADESAALHEPWDGDGLAPDEAYGQAKVACERAVLEAYPEALVARSGLIVGHGDRSDRFGYWPARFARAASCATPVLVPPLSDALQVIDVEDFASWLVRAAELRIRGTVNATGDPTFLTDLMDTCDDVTGNRPRRVEPDHAWLVGEGVEPWMGPESLPLWLPHPEYAGLMTRDNDAAKRAGLTFRPLVESVRSALGWERELGLDRLRRAGLGPQREHDLLARWASSPA